MKLQRLNCPKCNGFLNMEITKKSDYIFCPYCGQQFFIDKEKQEYTFNKNININKIRGFIEMTRNISDIQTLLAPIFITPVVKCCNI